MTRRTIKRLLFWLKCWHVIPGFVVTVGFRLFRLRSV